MFNPRSQALLDAVRTRVVVGDGAMGTMIQESNPTLVDYENHEGCNEVLNVTRPDIIRSIHSRYLKAGAEAIETNTFGANLANLAEYGIESRIYELARAGAEIARETADLHSTEEQPRWVLGSVGPGTKLPSLGHAAYATLRDTYRQQVAGLIDGGIDAVIIETTQDLLQAKSAVVGAKRAMAAAAQPLPIIVSVTIETTGTMLLGSEIGAALTTLTALGIDVIGLNCATGPAEMSEHLRYLARFSKLPIVVMPNAGLPVLGPGGAHYPLTPGELATAQAHFVRDYGAGLVGGCCGTTPQHIAELAAAVKDLTPTRPATVSEPGLSSLYQHQPFDQTMTYLSIGERTNANGSKGFARLCWPKTGMTTLAATECAMPASWSAAWRHPRPSRSCSTQPNPPCSRPASSASAVARWSTPSTTRMATDQTRALPASCRLSKSTGLRSSP